MRSYRLAKRGRKANLKRRTAIWLTGSPKIVQVRHDHVSGMASMLARIGLGICSSFRFDQACQWLEYRHEGQVKSVEF